MSYPDYHRSVLNVLQTKGNVLNIREQSVWKGCDCSVSYILALLYNFILECLHICSGRFYQKHRLTAPHPSFYHVSGRLLIGYQHIIRSC